MDDHHCGVHCMILYNDHDHDHDHDHNHQDGNSSRRHFGTMALSKSPGVDVSLDACWKSFDDNLSFEMCCPYELFRLRCLTQNGFTSEWGQIKKYYGLISDLLDLTEGKKPHVASLTKNLREWIDWYSQSGDIPRFTIKQVEDACYYLSRMIATLANVKRNGTNLPQRYESLQVLVDKSRVAYHWEHADWGRWGRNLGNWSTHKNSAYCNSFQVVTANAAERSKFLQS